MEMRNNLQKQEWDFSLNDKLEWEASDWEACYYYEYSRESKVFRESINQFRKENHGTSFDDYCKAVFKPFRRSSLPKNPYPYAVFNYCPEWPKQPFLSIRLNTVRERSKLMPTRQRTDALAPKDLNTVIAEYRDRAAPHLTAEQMQAFVDAFPNGRGTIETGPGRELVCFEIDWRDGPSEIARRFQAWLKADAPPEGLDGSQKTMLGGAVREHRGKGSPAAQFQNTLKALGALRLWRFYDGNWAKITMAAEAGDFALGSQFDHQSAWSRARKTANDRIALFNF